MAETSREEAGKSRKMAVSTNLSLEMDRFPRDLLRGFMSSSAYNGGRNSRNETCREDHSTNGDDEIELNLGLSLGGRLGVDKTPGKLKRSSSIVGTMPIFREQEESEASAAAAQSLNCNYTAGLTRTTSLPAEMEEEWRKRKEIQTLRRMEAKRRRFGKPRSCRITSSGNSDTHTTSFALEGWITTGDGGSGANRQGSSNSCGEERSSNFITRCSSLPKKEKPGISETKLNETEKPGMRRCNSINGRGKETPGTMQTMPCVFTKGEGPNGRRIEGILYKYGKGKEVRIMCICHGSFLSPAEFVRHAGGGDVDHPLRHIVVNTSSASSLLL